MKRRNIPVWLAIIFTAASLRVPGAQPEAAGNRSLQEQSRRETQILTVTPSQLAARAASYRGRPIQVKARLAEVLGPHVFVVADPRSRGEEVLVLIPVLRPYALGGELLEEAGGTPVRVVGTVRLLDRREFETEYEWFSINLFRDPERMADWQGRPVVVAHSVRTASGRELVDQEASGFSARASAQLPVGPQVTRLNRPIGDLRTLFAIDDLDRLLRMRVLLDAVQVQRVLNGRWIMVGTAGEAQVLVQLPRGHPGVRIGDVVHVSGVIRQMPASPWTLGLSEDQLALAERQNLYIYADDVERR